jgi:4-amino-4-deoxy-L-arabinose transferase-like glycosyltransferase
LAAYIIAALPLVWEYYGLLYPEALAVPLVLLVVYLFLGRQPTPKLAIGLGVVSGIGLLVRPTSFFLFAGVLAAWVIAAGWRRGVALTALSVLVAALVVVPWTIRNYVVLDGFVPISIQDAFIYGVFNDESANDPEYPYAWRAFLEDNPDILEGPRVPDPELRSELQELALEYIADHPFSVAEAFYWNGLSRYWDIRRPARVTAEAPFVGGTKTLSLIGLIAHWIMLPLAIYGLWRLRGRPSLWVPLVAIAVTASVVFTVGAATRYRAPIEPLIAILAVYAVTQLSSLRTTSTSRSQT